MPVKKTHGRRRVGRPRKAGRRRAQAGGQLGALLPLAKFVAPLVMGELLKFGVRTGLGKLRGSGFGPAGSGLKLAGAGHMGFVAPRRRLPQKRRVAGRKKSRRKPGMVRIQPFPFPMRPV